MKQNFYRMVITSVVIGAILGLLIMATGALFG